MIQDNTDADGYVIAIDMGPFIEYYGKREVLYRTIGSEKKDHDWYFKQMNDLMDKGKSIYIIESGITSYDPARAFLKGLVEGYELHYINYGVVENWYAFSSIRQSFMRERLFKLEKKIQQPGTR